MKTILRNLSQSSSSLLSDLMMIQILRDYVKGRQIYLISMIFLISKMCVLEAFYIRLDLVTLVGHVLELRYFRKLFEYEKICEENGKKRVR